MSKQQLTKFIAGNCTIGLKEQKAYDEKILQIMLELRDEVEKALESLSFIATTPQRDVMIRRWKQIKEMIEGCGYFQEE